MASEVVCRFRPPPFSLASYVATGPAGVVTDRDRWAVRSRTPRLRRREAWEHLGGRSGDERRSRTVLIAGIFQARDLDLTETALREWVKPSGPVLPVDNPR